LTTTAPSLTFEIYIFTLGVYACVRRPPTHQTILPRRNFVCTAYVSTEYIRRPCTVTMYVGRLNAYAGQPILDIRNRSYAGEYDCISYASRKYRRRLAFASSARCLKLERPDNNVSASQYFTFGAVHRPCTDRTTAETVYGVSSNEK